MLTADMSMYTKWFLILVCFIIKTFFLICKTGKLNWESVLSMSVSQMRLYKMEKIENVVKWSHVL